jgi:hypothetical protein
MARKAQDGFSIPRLQVLSSFLFHSELWEGTHLCAELVGNGFFLEFTSIGNFLVTKIEKGAYFRVFCVKNPGVKSGRKMTNFAGQKSVPKMTNFIRQTDFALISTIFIRWGSNFT